MKDIWVTAEHASGEWLEITLELLQEAKRLNRTLEAKIVALVFGGQIPSKPENLGEYGADEVYIFEDALFESQTAEVYTGFLSDLIQKEAPHILLMGATTLGKDLAPRLACRLKTGLVAGCVVLKIDRQGHLDMTRPLYRGGVYSTWECPDRRPYIVTILPGVIGKGTPAGDKKAKFTRVPCEVGNTTSQTRVIGIIPADPRTVDIREADTLVALGRGLGSSENLSEIQELAEILKAAISGSRPSVDAGWLGPERQIGITGKTVSAKLIIACGISGATQFTVGLKDCEFVVAVNTDRAAPIFKSADIAVVSDMHQLLPRLTSCLEEIQPPKTN